MPVNAWWRYLNESQGAREADLERRSPTAVAAMQPGNYAANGRMVDAMPLVL